MWLSGPRAAGEGHQARKHGYGGVLLELGLATASQQASADSCDCALHLVLRRQPTDVCRHSKLLRLQQILGRISPLHGLKSQLKNTRQATGM